MTNAISAAIIFVSIDTMIPTLGFESTAIINALTSNAFLSSNIVYTSNAVSTGPKDSPIQTPFIFL